MTLSYFISSSSTTTETRPAVFVVEAYGVESRSAKTAIDRLRSSGARVLGAVLTKFDSRKASYGYGYDYGYGYGMTGKTASNGHENGGQ